MKKYILNMTVVSNDRLGDKHILMKLTDESPLPEMRPGQFVEVKVDHSEKTFLRRPISIHFIDKEKNELWLLIQLVGDVSLLQHVSLSISLHNFIWRLEMGLFGL